MQTLREQYDLDRVGSEPIYSIFPTDLNRYNLHCSSCNSLFYVNKETYDQAFHFMEEGLDNPFTCDDCDEEFIEMEHRTG